MDFAKKLMEKYGWKEGDGLGKYNTGINKALKANLKFDTVGLGVDQAADFNNHWWERVYNEAASNIDVKTDGDKISMEVKDVNSVEITTKEYSMQKLKTANDNNQSYSNFLKTATLTNMGNEETDLNGVHAEDIQMAQFKPLTDEQLFAACGGRTAHKGARHGLKLSGKLSRIEEQEKMLLAKMQNNMENKETNDWTVVKNKKKKKDKKNKKIEYSPDSADEAAINKIIYSTVYPVKYTRGKRQVKLENDLSNCFNSISFDKTTENAGILGLNEKSKSIKKQKKNKKSKNTENDAEWCAYRNPEIREEMEQNKDVSDNQDDDDEFHYNMKKNESSYKEKKKQKNKSKKYAKKVKKTLENITENIDNSMDIVND